MKNIIRTVGTIAFWIIIGYVCIFMIMHTKESTASVVAVCKLWFHNVLPVLFPFFVISSLLVQSGACELLAGFFQKPMSRVFHVSGRGALPLVISFLSGYPVGSKTVCELYDTGRLSKQESEILINTCSNAGPLFILGTVGMLFFGSMKTGMILLLCVYSASLTTGWIKSRLEKSQKQTVSKVSYLAPINKPSISAMITAGVEGALRSILLVGAFMLLFSVFGTALLQSSMLIKLLALLPDKLGKSFFYLISGTVEITGGLKGITSLSIPFLYQLIIAGFLLGFGGICINMQSLSYLSKAELNQGKFVGFKLVQGIITGMFSGIAALLCYDDVLISCFSPAIKNTSVANLSYSFGYLFILSSVILYWIMKRREKRKQHGISFRNHL